MCTYIRQFDKHILQFSKNNCVIVSATPTGRTSMRLYFMECQSKNGHGKKTNKSAKNKVIVLTLKIVLTTKERGDLLQLRNLSRNQHADIC